MKKTIEKKICVRQKKPKGENATTYLSQEDSHELKLRAKMEGRSVAGQIRYYVLRGLNQDRETERSTLVLDRSSRELEPLEELVPTVKG